MRPVHYYYIGAGSWFVCHGLQGVLFAWLVTMVLRETPGNVGVAQMAMLAPAMLLMLIGGSVADRFGGKRVAMVAHVLAIVPALLLIVTLAAGRLDFHSMVLYALAMGCALAFVTPARDGLLNHVAEGRVQRTVVKATLIQFTVQACGALLAGLAQVVGAVAILAFQATALAVGALAYSRIHVEVPSRAVPAGAVRDLLASVAEGCRTVWRSRSMRAVAGQNIAMGICFMGSYIVTIPLLVREVYAGDALDLALVQAVNGFGLVITILVMLRGEDVQRQGRALLLAHGVGGVFLAAAGLGLGFSTLLACVFLWGACGGVAMSMSRTIMQVEAPEGQRGRVMAFFSFSFMGAGPLGALACGYLVDWIGPGASLGVASAIMASVAIVFGLKSSLWRLGSVPPEEARPENLAGAPSKEPRPAFPGADRRS